MARAFTDDDVGKTVLNSDGTEVGTVMEVHGDTAHVDMDAGITDQIKAKLGWGEADEDAYPLEHDRVETITDDEIRLH